MMPATHDPLCPLVKLSVLKSGCPQCDLIRKGRKAALEDAVTQVEAEFPRPTLGVQKILRMLRGMADA